MQAILLLAHKGIDYIDNFCSQFTDDFNIYIHYDKKLKLSNTDINMLQTKYPNIRHVFSQYSGEYFGMSLIDAEIELLKIAIKDNENTYFHLMSEQCYLIINPKIFVEYFNNSTLNFMEFEYDKEGWQIISKEHDLRWAGSQWWSLSKHAVEWILNILETTHYYTMFETDLSAYNYGRKIRIIAADETFFTNMFKLYNNDFEFEHNKRYYDFTWPLIDWSHPHLLVIDKIQQYINENIIGNFICRKIDFKNNQCMQLLQQIQYINRYAGNITFSS